MSDYDALIPTLQDLVGTENLYLDEPMSLHTTFEIGGPADLFVEPQDLDSLVGVMALLREKGIEPYVLGCGSDILVSDDGLRGIVVHLGDGFASMVVEGNRMIVGAAATNEEVAEASCALGLAGYEFASGIPGSVGGAAIMNAGAYEGEFKDVATSVTCLTPEGDVVEIPAEEADWGYRHSMMSDRGYLVIGAEFLFRSDDPSAIRARIDELTERRAAKQPLELASAGSTFKRPAGYFAGALIDGAGMRGESVGAAQVSPKHAGFVVNNGGASAAEVRELIARVQDKVFETSGVRLEPEVRFWGF